MSDINGYWAILSRDPENNSVVAEFPNHPNVFTCGMTREHALEMASEALNATLEAEFDRHLPLPKASEKPSVGEGEEAAFISLDPEIWTAFLVRSWREEKGFTQAQLARKMGISTQAYQRMERPGRSNLTVATLTRIAVALEKNLVLRVE